MPEGTWRERRRQRWDRPPPPHDWRWIVGHVGRVLIATGLLMFGFVAYQLWGTGLQYAQAQDRLDEEFADLLAATTTTSSTTSTTTTTTTVAASPDTVPPSTAVPSTTAPVQALPPIEEGDVIARIEAPSIGLDAKVVAGVSTADLRLGPGHYPDTPLPGQLGNSAIAGHRTTYGQPFFRVDDLVPGDEIVLTTVAGRFTYRVTGTQIVAPSDSQVIATTDPTTATLTLTSCHPAYTADQRIIVSATLDPAASDRPGAPVRNYGRPEPAAPVDTLPGDPPATTAPSTDSTAPTTATTVEAGGGPATVPPTTAPTASTAPAVTDEAADAFDQGWFDDDGALPQVALWGTALAAIAIGAYAVSRRTRRDWVGALVGIVPFVICLYFFFQNVNRLLPAAL